MSSGASEREGRRPPLPTRTPESAVPRFDQTIDRRLVHRAAVAEVLVTDVMRTGEAVFRLGIQWPRAHTFYGADRAGRHDPMLVAECIRQAGLLLAHLGYGIPPTYQFVFRDLDFRVVDDSSMLIGAAPTDLDTAVTCTEVRQRGEVLRSMRVNLELRGDGGVVAEGSGAVTCVEPSRYPALRWRRGAPQGSVPIATPPPSVAPAAVGRTDERDVVLGVTGDEDAGWWSLRVLPEHPVLFDHPLDHIPGMLQLEAFRQAALSSEERPEGAPSPLLAAVRIECLRYAELDRPVLCHAQQSGGGAHELRLTQDGEDVATGSVTFR
jgi:2-oxo-3-(phosphooxy)propyl 3-oxoalkanoate synthase